MVIELFLIGVGLSMDAFAVSVCKGLGMEKINKKHAFLIGLYFGCLLYTSPSPRD